MLIPAKLKINGLQKNKELTSLSFFSGCLGLDLGLEKAGIHQLLACDFDKHCRNSIASNRPDTPVIDDITLYDAADIRKLAGLRSNQRPTLIVGGPPCQAFSTAGKRKSFKDPRGNVFLKYIDLINELQPDFAVIENVRGLLSAPLKHRPHEERGKGFPSLTRDELPGGALYYVVKVLESYGYAVSFNLYNSANFGVPQVRERVVLIAARDGKKVPYLRPTHSDDQTFGLDKWLTFKHATKGLKEKDMVGAKFSEDRLKFYRMLGPGLGVSILGEVKAEFASLLQRADAIFTEELRNTIDEASQKSWYDLTSQAFAVFLPVKSVGVMGDGRTYEYVVALRAVQTQDFMTAHWAHLPHELLGKVSNRIINEVRGINRVVCDISGKPPATIEWE